MCWCCLLLRVCPANFASSLKTFDCVIINHGRSRVNTEAEKGGGERQGSRGRWYRKCSLEAHFALFTRIAKQGMDCQCGGSRDQCSGARWIHIDFCTLRFSSRLFINTSTLSFLNNRIEWRNRCPNRLACL